MYVESIAVYYIN
jgi:AdoMet-dependent rRNA methyltransferase SPB1